MRVCASSSNDLIECHFVFLHSFGKRTSGSGRRGSDCLLLEASELLVVSFDDIFCIPFVVIDYSIVRLNLMRVKSIKKPKKIPPYKLAREELFQFFLWT